MTSQTGEQIDVHGQLERPLEQWHEPGAPELCDLVGRMLNGSRSFARTLDLERLKTGVYRLRIGGGPMRTVMLKRLKPAIAQTDRLVMERWLPALGLAHRSPRLLGSAAERDGCWVWHAYEDIGDETLDARRDPLRLEAAVALVAELHTRAANHPLMPEVRWRARDHGVHFFTSNLRDAIAALEALAALRRDVPSEFDPARTRLLRRLYELLEDAPRRVQVMEQVGGPDTLLHGDLWPKNVFVTAAEAGVRAQFIDWDHVGAGPFSYDLSTFLYRASPEERPWILRWYREAVERAGWHFPEPGELNLLLHTAESARYIHCLLFVAMAILHDDAEWAINQLVDWDRWFEAVRPLLQD
jgi:thiamine kinase-like enzyme